MLKLKTLGEPKPVPFETMPEKLEFQSPNATMSIVFHSAEEIRMAHYVWKISVFKDGIDITKPHSLGDQYFFLPIYYSSLISSYYDPWSYQEDILCLYFVTDELEIITKFYSFKAKTYVIPPLSNTTTLLCSPISSDVLTISYDSQISAWSPIIVNLDGKIIFQLPFSGTPLDLFISWIKPFPCFFAIFHNPEEKKTDLYFYEGLSKEFTEKIPLEPSQLVPYKEVKHLSKEIDLKTPSALKTLAFGDFLNKWDEIGFNSDSNTLILRFVRPCSESFTEEGQEYVNIQKYEVQYTIEVPEVQYQMTETTIKELSALVAKFIRDRDWNKYHTPKNLAMSISIEAAEIMELFQWVTNEEAIDNVHNDPSLKKALEEELADVMIYLISMTNTCDIDIAQAIRSKLTKNELRFPVTVVAGKLGPYKINNE